MRAVVLGAGVVWPLVLAGQGATPRAAPFTAVTGSFFALSVADIQASADWYQEKLGLRVIMTVPPQSGTAVTVLAGGGLTVELIQHDRAVPLATAAPAISNEQFIHGIVKVGFAIEDFEGTVTRLRARGIAIAAGPFPARPDQPANVLIRDNAGTLIQLFGK